MPASTTTERQTWRRVMPAARRTPISRTRSRTLMVSVLTMPSAATRTATSARASNSPKTRPSASLDGALDPVERDRARGPSWRGRRARPVAAVGVPRRARSGRRRRRRRRRRARSSRRASRRGRPRRSRPGSDRSTMPATRRSRSAAVGDRARAASWPTVQPEPRGRRCRQDRGAAGVERGRGPRRGRRRRTEPAVGGEVGADHRRRIERDAVDGDVERRDRADPRRRRARGRGRVGDAPRRRRRADRGQTSRRRGRRRRARPAAAARACWPTPPSATTIARPMASAPSGQRRPAPVADDRAAGEALLERGGASANGQPGEPGERPAGRTGRAASRRAGRA